VTAHQGRIVKLIGDGTLIEFPSVIAAVTCAVEMQKQINSYGAQWIRIGGLNPSRSKSG
jgi:class 3 adenylate cyclase